MRVAVERTVTVAEAATILGLHQKTVRNLINNGDLKARKIGNKWLILDEAMQDYLNELRG